MPPETRHRRKFTKLVLFTAAGWTLYALGRERPAEDSPSARCEAHVAPPTPAYEPATRQAEASGPRRGLRRRRRLATSLAFATLFFAGAAFSAGAGDIVADAIETDPPAATDDPPATSEAEPPATTESEPPAEEPATPEPPAEEPGPIAEEPVPPADDPAEEPVDPPASDGEPSAPPAGESVPAAAEPSAAEPSAALSTTEAANVDAPAEVAPQPEEAVVSASPSQPTTGARPARPVRSDPPVVRSSRRSLVTRDAEADQPGTAATIWLHRELPPVTQPSKRLRPSWAEMLRVESRRAGAPWALVLGVLRAQGLRGATPASRLTVASLAERLVEAGARTNARRAVLALFGRRYFADRAIALTRLHRAVGLDALVEGLDAVKPKLSARLLADRRIDVYAAGRQDIAAGRVDVRVVALVLYLAEAHGQVTVSSLISGHRLYSRPGKVSAHIYGLAVDVAALHGRSIVGNQAPGGLTERAVRNVLLLPSELRPRQVISLLGLGGPSFPLADHDDHIHVGY